jgi:hypothetical protein
MLLRRPVDYLATWRDIANTLVVSSNSGRGTATRKKLELAIFGTWSAACNSLPEKCTIWGIQSCFSGEFVARAAAWRKPDADGTRCRFFFGRLSRLV